MLRAPTPLLEYVLGIKAACESITSAEVEGRLKRESVGLEQWIAESFERPELSVISSPPLGCARPRAPSPLQLLQDNFDALWSSLGSKGQPLDGLAPLPPAALAVAPAAAAAADSKGARSATPAVAAGQADVGGESPGKTSQVTDKGGSAGAGRQGPLNAPSPCRAARGGLSPGPLPQGKDGDSPAPPAAAAGAAAAAAARGQSVPGAGDEASATREATQAPTATLEVSSGLAATAPAPALASRNPSPARAAVPVVEAAAATTSARSSAASGSAAPAVVAPAAPAPAAKPAPAAAVAVAEAARRSPAPSAAGAAAHLRTAPAGDGLGAASASAQPGAAAPKRLEAPQPQRPGGGGTMNMSVSQRIQMFETKSTPCLRQAGGPSRASAGQVAAAAAPESAAAAASATAHAPAQLGGAHAEKAAGAGAGAKSSSSYAPALKPVAASQAGKEFPRSQSEMRGGPRPQGTSQSARLWRPASANADAAEAGRPGMTASASVGRFPSPPAGVAAPSSQGGSARAPAVGGSRPAEVRAVGAEAFERLAAGGKRNDVERPKSLKAAEQAKLQEEQRQLAKQQEEELKQQAKLQQQLQQQQVEQQRLLQQQQQQQQERQQQERQRQQRELEREREKAKAATAAAVAATATTAAAAVQAASAAAAAGYPAAASAAPSAAAPAASAAEEEEQEPEAEASARIEPQPAPEPDASLDDGGALTDCEDERPVVAPPEPPCPASLLRTIQIPPKREEDNYVISEHGSDSEAEDQEQDKRRNSKHIPKWCETYLKELGGQSDLDPDSIFGPKVPRCVLEDIFTDQMYQEVNKHRPKRARGSSGDWRKDRLAKHEVRNYKSRMGQTRVWDPEASRAIVAASSSGAAGRN